MHKGIELYYLAARSLDDIDFVHVGSHILPCFLPFGYTSLQVYNLESGCFELVSSLHRASSAAAVYCDGLGFRQHLCGPFGKRVLVYVDINGTFDMPLSILLGGTYIEQHDIRIADISYKFIGIYTLIVVLAAS